MMIKLSHAGAASAQRIGNRNGVFDFYYYLMNLKAEPGAEDNSGLVVRLPDRRADRKRAGDVFFALLSQEGNAPLSASEQADLLDRAADVYFRAGGSVTAGMRAAGDAINEFFFARNLRNSSQGKQATAILNLGVYHGGVALVAHAGSTHTFFISNSRVAEFADESAGRGLGLSKSVELRFSQESIAAGDIVLFSPKPPASWTPALLAGAPQLNRNILRRRLLNQVNTELRAAIIEFQPGNGGLHPLRLRSAQTDVVAPQAQPVVDEAPVAAAKPIRAALETSQPPMSMPIEAPANEVPPVTVRAAETRPVEPGAEPSVSEPVARPSAATRRRARPEAHAGGLRTFLAGFLKTSRNVKRRMDGSVQRFTARVLPEKGEQLPKLSTTGMLVVAIAVPVLIVALATAIYIRSGRDEQQKALVYVAQQIADQAASAAGAEAQEFAWNEVLKQITEAEKFGQSEASNALREKAQSSIDALHGVRRLSYTSALAGGFDGQVEFTRLVVSSISGDLYALDALVGRVIRFESTRNGYVLDRNFTCGPSQVGAIIVGPLVDIVPLPRNNLYNADVMGIDATGTLLYCQAGETGSKPFASRLVADHGWGKITAMTLYNGQLYVLDPINNIIWRYDTLYDNFVDPPHQLDINLQNLISAVDLDVYEDDLFVISSNGQTSKCTFRSSYSWEMLCEEPAPYIITDTDGNRNPYDILEGTTITQTQTTYPLEPSLYILDQASNSVYRFSVAMQMQYRMSPSQASAGLFAGRTVSAFVVTPAQKLILAFSDQLYVADLPVP